GVELADVKARIVRLEALAQGLAQEVSLWRGNEKLLLFREQRGYLRGIPDAIAAAEGARVTLARVGPRPGSRALSPRPSARPRPLTSAGCRGSQHPQPAWPLLGQPCRTGHGQDEVIVVALSPCLEGFVSGGRHLDAEGLELGSQHAGFSQRLGDLQPPQLK